MVLFTIDQRIAIAKAHLDTAIFGLVEHFRATKCLWKFQFGHKITPEECDCRLAPQTNRRRSQSPKPDSEREKIDSVHVGVRKTTRETLELGSLDELRRVSESSFGLLYSYALMLFLERARVVEIATSIKLVCGLD